MKLSSHLLLSALVLSASQHAFASNDNCNADKGRKQFNQCIACHSNKPNEHKMGPTLFGIYGTKAGSQESFSYSIAMEDSSIVWDEKTLAKFLESPMTYIPGNSMPFGGIKKDDKRDSVICYLKQLK